MNFYSLVVLAATVAGVASQTVMVNTPTSVVNCLPVQLSWSGGVGPYYLSLIPGGQASGAALEDLGQQTGTTYVWKADLPAGTAVTVQIRDSNGQLNYSDQFTVQPGSSTCASGAGKSSGTSSASAPVTTGTASASPKNTSSPGSSGSSGSTSNSSSATPKNTTTSTSTTPSSSGTAGNTASTSTNSSASTDAKNDASRTSAGFVAIAVAAVVAVFA